MKSLLKRNIFLIVLLLICCFVCYQNYTSGTFLTGWDTLHPEFNLKLYWNRIVDGVWQEHQGLGAIASQAHASEVPRFLILLLLSLILKLSQIRYAYTFLMLVAGPAGIYFLLKWLISKNSTASFSIGFASFAGGLFYLLNLGTLQHFHVPLEMFLTHYGLLGFTFLYAIKYFDEGKRRNLVLFLVFSLLIAPQAHTSTLFYSYFLIFAVFFGLLALTYLLRKISPPAVAIRKYATLLVLTVFVNSFWFFPNIYFVVNHGKEIQQAKISHLFSSEAFLANQNYGTIENVAILKNFLFGWGEHIGNAEFGELLQEWNLHLDKPFVLGLGYMFFGFIIIGLTLLVITKQKHVWAFAGVLVTSMFFLFNDNPPFGFIFRFFQDNMPLFREAFRFPFTKFSISLMLSFSVFFGYFFYFITKAVERWFKSVIILNTVRIVLYGALILSLSYFMKPAFFGYLISPSMRVNIPNRYFQLFSYLDGKEEYGRVAHLPIHTFWGWVYYNWDPFNELGYQGAGFLWFGIKQPLMDREFDRWNLFNEGYYMEMSRAVYSESPVLFKQALDKYKIRWVLLDESIIVPGGEQSELFYKEIKQVISGIPDMSLDKDFGSGLKLFVYKPKNDFSLYEKVDSFYSVQDSIFKEADDPIYSKLGNYISSGSKSFPFVGITNYDESILPKYISSDESKVFFKISDADDGSYSTNNGLVGSYDLLGQTKQGDLSLELVSNTSVGKVSGTSLVSNYSQYSVLEVSGQLFKLNSDQVEGSSVYFGRILTDFSQGIFSNVYKETWSKPLDQSNYSVLENCSEAADNASYQANILSDGFTLTGRGLRACVTTGVSELLPSNAKEGDIVKISFGGDSFAPIKDVCVFNDKRGLCENVVLVDRANYILLKAPISEYNVRFFADARNSVLPVSATFKNLSLALLTRSDSVPFSIDNQSSPRIISDKGIVLSFSKNSDYSGEVEKFFSNSRPCDGEGSQSGYKITKDTAGITYLSEGKKSLCDSFWFPNFPHNTGLVLEVESKNISGSPLRICLTNEYSKKCDLYVELPANKDRTKNFYLIPPTKEGVGYTVNISNLVFGAETTSNQIYYLGLTPVPYEFLKSLSKEVIPTSTQSLLIYNQAYEKGWLAMCGWKVCDAKHVLVNNWANGWVFEDGSYQEGSVKVIFWPQVLEYFGFILVVFCFIYGLKHPTRS